MGECSLANIFYFEKWLFLPGSLRSSILAQPSVHVGKISDLFFRNLSFKNLVQPVGHRYARRQDLLH
jgi:hypothetical protein